MEALINLAVSIVTFLVAWGVVSVFPESVEKIKKVTKASDAGVVVMMWVALAFAAFAAKDIIGNGPMTQAIGGVFTSIAESLK